MRIVQTFWTAGRDPLKYSFGWAHAEYNLMSWTLSCLSLREHYDEVALYTDREGYDVLISKLHLPYTEVNVVYDKNLCLPHHWAYAKIKTYSMQTKPFIHVDGDVYLPHPIPEDISNAPLIAQNKEIGTEYYKRMIDKILQVPSVKLPKYLAYGVREESISSYNMGIFGGNELEFIKLYSFNSLILFEKGGCGCSDGNLNILFEQINFAAMCVQEKKMVTTLIDKDITDNGYTDTDFCSLDRYNQHKIFHLLGGHKQRKDILEALCRLCLIKYPNYFDIIIRLFPQNHRRLLQQGEIGVITTVADNIIHEFIEFINITEQYWKKISKEDLRNIEKSKAKSTCFSSSDLEKCFNMNLRCHPYYRYFCVPSTWNEMQIKRLREYLSCKNDEIPLGYVGIIPSVNSNLRYYYILQQMDIEILNVISKNTISVSQVMSQLLLNVSDNDKDGYLYHILVEIKLLIKNHIILTI